MKPFVTLGMALLLCGMLCGCMNSLRLKDRAIVQALGIDRSEGGYQLTLQYFVPTSSGEGDSRTNRNGLLSASGDTLSEAIENASRSYGREVFFGSNKVIVLGQSVAEMDAHDPIDYLNTHHQLHPSMILLLAEGEAADIVGDEKSDAAEIEKLAETALHSHRMTGGTLLDAVTQMKTGSLELPILRQGEEGFLLEGAGLLDGEKLVDELTPSEVEGVLWLNGEIGRNLLHLSLPDGGICVLEILSGRTEKRVHTDTDGGLIFDFSIHADCAVRELTGSKRGEREMAEELRHLAEQKILQLCRRALEKTVQKNGADLFELGTAVRHFLPDYAQKYRDSLPSRMQNSQVDLRISCIPSRIGLEADENKR